MVGQSRNQQTDTQVNSRRLVVFVAPKYNFTPQKIQSSKLCIFLPMTMMPSLGDRLNNITFLVKYGDYK